jgi:hypothetical protein
MELEGFTEARWFQSTTLPNVAFLIADLIYCQGEYVRWIAKDAKEWVGADFNFLSRHSLGKIRISVGTIGTPVETRTPVVPAIFLMLLFLPTLLIFLLSHLLFNRLGYCRIMKLMSCIRCFERCEFVLHRQTVITQLVWIVCRGAEYDRVQGARWSDDPAVHTVNYDWCPVC